MTRDEHLSRRVSLVSRLVNYQADGRGFYAALRRLIEDDRSDRPAPLIYPPEVLQTFVRDAELASEVLEERQNDIFTEAAAFLQAAANAGPLP